MSELHVGPDLEPQVAGRHHAAAEELAALASQPASLPDLGPGPGTLAILRQIEWASREGFAHLYLGYWIHGHRKMDYKRRFHPLEAFDGRGWSDFQPPP